MAHNSTRTEKVYKDGNKETTIITYKVYKTDNKSRNYIGSCGVTSIKEPGKQPIIECFNTVATKRL